MYVFIMDFADLDETMLDLKKQFNSCANWLYINITNVCSIILIPLFTCSQCKGVQCSIQNKIMWPYLL